MNLEFRKLCTFYIPYSRTLTLPFIPKLPQRHESVLIEFRSLPHIEFLVRNMIHKLGPNWSHTVVCGNTNHSQIREISASIPNLRILKLNVNNLTQNDYSEYLCTREFWDLLYGEKILIYQEDSCMFKTNIMDFMNSDYIGAPYSNVKSTQYVGNGGLSIRSRSCMLKVINQIELSKFTIPTFTQSYCEKMRLRYCPEDVYFSTNMQDLSIGKVAEWEDAYRFSTDSIANPNACGGHQFWNGNDNWRDMFTNIIKRFNIPSPSHWRDASLLTYFNKSQLINTSASFLFIDIASYFETTRATIKTNWGGIYTTPVKMHSLSNCKFIICTSEFVKQQLIILEIPIYVIHSYIPDINSRFIMEEHQIVQIGNSNKISSLYKISTPSYKKIWLTGDTDMKKSMSLLQQNALDHSIVLNKGVEVKYLDDMNMVNKSIVFVDLYENGVIPYILMECMARNTPILINRFPYIEEYLGSAYPLYYTNLDEIKELVNETSVQKTINYMKCIERFDITTYMIHFCNIKIYL